MEKYLKDNLKIKKIEKPKNNLLLNISKEGNELPELLAEKYEKYTKEILSNRNFYFHQLSGIIKLSKMQDTELLTSFLLRKLLKFFKNYINTIDSKDRFDEESEIFEEVEDEYLQFLESF